MAAMSVKALLVLAALAMLTLSGCGSPAPRHPAPTVTRQASPSPSPVTSATGISAWVNGAGYRAFKKLTGELGLPGKAYKTGGMAEMARACSTLATQITAAQQAPPIPDARAEREYSLALTDWENGAVDCQDGATSGDASLLAASVRHTTAGNAYFQRATKRIVALIRASG
jgi:hypothetical protein